MPAIKITPADSAFSKCVRERANWRCERCGGVYLPGTQGLHCSHFYGRGNWSVRFEPLNGTALDMGCHLYLSANPEEHRAFQLQRIGEQNMAILTELKNNTNRGKEYRKTKGVGEVARHYRMEYMRMQETGSREFAGWI